MKHSFRSGIRGPLAPGTGIVLGAASRRGRAPCPDRPDQCGGLPFAGNCPCGSIPRPL